MTEKLMIAVYGAASETVADIHKDNAYKVGQIIADSNMSVIFGGGSTIITMIAGLIPARKAAKMSPVKALRSR